MFWGLIMEPKRRYSQQVKRPFHISMAALDIFAADDSPTQLMLYFEERNYLLCTLQKGHTVQCQLDLNFEAGDEVVFATNGHCNIHLSGYLQDQLDYLDGDLEEEEEDEEEEADVEENGEKSKRASRKKKLNVTENEKTSPKKSKLESLLHEEFDSDDEDDESFAISNADEDEDDDDIEEEEEDDDEVEDDAEEDESDNEDEVEEKPAKPDVKAMNGEKPKKSKKQEKTKNEKPKKEAPLPKQGKQKDNKNAVSPQKRTVEGGVVIQDLRLGEGTIAKSGKVVQVYYEGRLKQNNKLFDQSNKGSGFKFRLGKQEVIKGWDVGVVGMKVGGRRRIICPPAMAYGQKGSPPAIPPNSTLMFEVELKNVI